MTQEPQDPFGMRALATPIKDASDFVTGLLKRVCYPAAEEYGEHWRDRVSAIRRRNLQALAEKTAAKLGDRTGKSPPRIVFEVLEKGSWTDNVDVQEMWAGLLASSCTSDGADDGNIIFISLLEKLTASQVRLLNHVVGTSKMWKEPEPLTFSAYRQFTIPELQSLMGIEAAHRVFFELEHLKTLSLLEITRWTLNKEPQEVIVKASHLGINLYVRAQGFEGSITEFFKDRIEDPKSPH